MPDPIALPIAPRPGIVKTGQRAAGVTARSLI
jgi:hypothetical protein